MLRSNVLNYFHIVHKIDFQREVERSFLLNRKDFVDTYNPDVDDMPNLEEVDEEEEEDHGVLPRITTMSLMFLSPTWIAVTTMSLMFLMSSRCCPML